MNNPNPITEADMLAYLRDVTAYYAQRFPEVRDLSAGAAHGNIGVSLFGYTDAKYNSAVGIGLTFRDASADLRNKLGTSVNKAKQLRADAAEMLAQADKLEGAK